MDRVRAAALALALLAAACGGETLAPGACLTSRDCDPDAQCVSGACVALTQKTRCRVDEDCGGEQYCDFGACKTRDPGPSITPSAADAGTADVGEAPKSDPCAGDGECKPGQICAAGLCVPGCAEIGSPVVCTNGDTCNVTTGRCETTTPRCTTDTACGAPNDVCEAGVCVAGCARAGCAAGLVCDPGTGRCATPPPCASDAQCGAPAGVCVGGRCEPGCGQPGAVTCAGGTVCDRGAGRCVAVAGPCANDAQCSAPNTVCEGGQCVPGCSQVGGVQCSGSTACNTNTGRCDAVPPPPCTSDAACNPPSTVCEFASGRCVAGCTASSCGQGQVCSTTTGRCESAPPPPASCVADTFEDNDTAAAASTAVPLDGTELTALTACDQDPDYYAVDLAVGDRVQIAVLFSNAEGDVDARLESAAGTTLVSSASVDDDEALDFTATTAGRHVLRVWLYRDQGPTPGNTYRLRITRTAAPPPPPPPPMCTADRLEENDTRTAARAIAAPVTEAGLTLCAGDDDYYAITLTPGDQLGVTLTFTHAEGDVDLRLLSSAGANLASSLTTLDRESISYTAFTPETVAVRAYLYRDQGSTPGNTYTVATTRTVVCPADRYEPNDDQLAQVALVAGTFTGLSLCAADADHFVVTLARNQRLTVTTRFTHAEGDIDLYVADDLGLVVAESTSTDDDESVTYVAPYAGDFTIATTLFQDLGTRPGNFYTLVVAY